MSDKPAFHHDLGRNDKGPDTGVHTPNILGGSRQHYQRTGDNPRPPSTPRPKPLDQFPNLHGEREFPSAADNSLFSGYPDQFGSPPPLASFDDVFSRLKDAPLPAATADNSSPPTPRLGSQKQFESFPRFGRSPSEERSFPVAADVPIPPPTPRPGSQAWFKHSASRGNLPDHVDTSGIDGAVVSFARRHGMHKEAGIIEADIIARQSVRSRKP